MVDFWWAMGLAHAYFLWSSALHFHHRHSFRQAAFQDGQTIIGSFRERSGHQVLTRNHENNLHHREYKRKRTAC